jgi:hypothetical protein
MGAAPNLSSSISHVSESFFGVPSAVYLRDFVLASGDLIGNRT